VEGGGAEEFKLSSAGVTHVHTQSTCNAGCQHSTLQLVAGTQHITSDHITQQQHNKPYTTNQHTPQLAAQSGGESPALPFFQLVSLHACEVVVDYRPRRVDVAAIKVCCGLCVCMSLPSRLAFGRPCMHPLVCVVKAASIITLWYVPVCHVCGVSMRTPTQAGSLVELLAMIPLGGLELCLPRVSLSGVAGWDALGAAVVSQWISHVATTQVREGGARVDVRASVFGVPTSLVFAIGHCLTWPTTPWC
jgi:hypothetical protein